MKIRIIADLSEVGQDSIKDYIGTEWQVKEVWQKSKKVREGTNWNGLEEGQVSVILHSDKDANTKNQQSILNRGEYEFI